MSELFGLLWQQPWYGLTALAVMLPIIIHLLNRSRGKLVTFAHVALLRSTKPQPTAELRLTQRLLLVLRILLLLIAAALLAAPLWPPTSSETEIIMLSQDWLNSSNQAEKQQVATRLGKQQAILLDSPAAQEQSQTLVSEDIINWQTQISNKPINLWSKIQSHGANKNTKSPLLVYATNRASQFVGVKVPVAQPIEWQLTAIDTSSSFAPLSVLLVYQNNRQRDKAYISAALSALQKQSRIAITLNSLSETAFTLALTNNNLPTSQVVLWLSSAPLAPELLEYRDQQTTIVMDAPKLESKGDNNQKWHLASPASLLVELAGTSLAISANPAFAQELSQVLWSTSKGEPLLSQLTTGPTTLVQFYSRFNPDWNNLTVLPTFPLILGELVQSALAKQQLTQQTIDIQQISQTMADSQLQQTYIVSPYELQHSVLQNLLSALLLVLFCIERLYSEKSSRTDKNAVVDGER